MNSFLPAKMYIQEGGFDAVLPFSSDGTYSNAMKSAKDMSLLIDRMTYYQDIAADMAW